MQHTTILHAVRRLFEISCNDYCLAELISFAGNDPRNVNPGWCTMSRNDMANELDFSRRSIINMINELEEKKLIERNENDHLKITAKWYDAVSAAKENRLGVQKVHTKKGSAKSSHPVQKVHTNGAKSSHPPVQKVHTTLIYKENINKESNCADAKLSETSDEVISLNADALIETPPPTPAPLLMRYEHKGKQHEIPLPDTWTPAMLYQYQNVWLPYHKKRTRTTYLPESIVQQIAKLASFTEAQLIECVNDSISNNYQGLFPEKYLKPNATSNTNTNTGSSATNTGTGADLSGIKYSGGGFRRRSGAV